MAEKVGYVYIMANRNDTTLYVGVTANLVRRVFEHRNRLCDGFTARYNVTKLVYFEQCGDMNTAIAREKQLKKGSRARKERLINGMNPEWNDLWDVITV